VDEYHKYETLTGVNVPSEGYFLDTGTRHYVRFVENLMEYDIVAEGREIRYNAPELQPVGSNVNFVEPKDGVLHVRTYEKGVEDETFACGTGIVASCVASFITGVKPSAEEENGRVRYDVMAKRDKLAVDFIPSLHGSIAQDVWLTGPAAYVAEIIL
jgi:diaminopimelate epimerase